jgi:hypothetical protein
MSSYGYDAAGRNTAITHTPSRATLWPASATPSLASANDPDAVELGVKFQSDTAGNQH